MTDPQTGLSFSQSNITVSLGFADTDNIPVFCITCISANDCTIREAHGKRTITVSSTIRDTIKSHFPKADTAGVFFQPEQFIDSLSELGMASHGKVKYFDFSPKGVIKEMIEYIAQYPGVVSKHNRLLFSMLEEANNEEYKQLKITEQNMKRSLFCFVKIPTLQEKKNIEFFFLRKGFPSQKNIQLGGESNRGKYTPLMNFSRGLNFNRLNGLSKTKLKQLNWCQVHRQKRPLQKFPSIFSENRGSFRIR